jgi:hypothetical protein
VRRHLTLGAPDQRYLADRAHRPHLAANDSHHQVGGLAAALGHVHVREGVVADDGVAGGEPGSAVVGVQISRSNDRCVLAHDVANRSQKVGLGVFNPLDHHRPVQVQQHAIYAPVALTSKVGQELGL